jgi:hypothetical protein
VVAGKKIDYIPFVIKNLNLHCGFELFYVICPKSDLDKVRAQSVETKQTLIVVDENLIIPNLNLDEVSKFLKSFLKDKAIHQMAGWYFQQFLKMGFAQYASTHPYYLIWDSDTLLTRPISFFENDKILLTQGNEYHSEYFQTIGILFDKINLTSKSHISQHLMVRTEDMINLIRHLQFSEYETYANYCLSTKPDSYRSIKRLWFRYGQSYFRCDLRFANISALSSFYDFVAFEDWDTGFLRTIRAFFRIFQTRLLMLFARYKNLE